MHTSTTRNKCQVFIHPAAANPLTIAAIQASTGLVVLVSPKRRTAVAAPATNPWGGDAA
ncbi:hypothetical protein NRB16_04035 [Pseudomonas sp. LJDD11]|uniref:hypothetical protein n=1 Tax=Pseudomonas sp. LJDD11 TaxID=2931984 RepID=UPI00211C0C74|nr:hypothetical protein [Pseudomonas sp. LJDD11]MCQ9422701.1 hypothetical protein [Pseudomonas sp. LJDD11]